MFDTQKQKILEMLRNNEWVCTSLMYASFIADPRKRLSDLKKKYTLEWRWCENPTHNHRGNMKEWRLIRDKVIIWPVKTEAIPVQEKLSTF